MTTGVFIQVSEHRGKHLQNFFSLLITLVIKKDLFQINAYWRDGNRTNASLAEVLTDWDCLMLCTQAKLQMVHYFKNLCLYSASGLNVLGFIEKHSRHSLFVVFSIYVDI